MSGVGAPRRRPAAIVANAALPPFDHPCNPMRSVATSLLLFIQTLIGFGLGPTVTGLISDYLRPSFEQNSLRYALVIIGGLLVAVMLFFPRGIVVSLADLLSMRRRRPA